MNDDNKMTIKIVSSHEGDRYEYCMGCNTHKKKAGPCTRCMHTEFALANLSPYSDIDKYGFHPSLGYIGHGKPRRATKEAHRLHQVLRLEQALNHAWICNINGMLRYARSHDGVNKLCIIVFHNVDLRHLILQIVHHMISERRSKRACWMNGLPPLQWP